MRIRSTRRSRWKLQPEVNLNSFLDLILNVLLFFVFATELAAFESLEVSVPVSKYSVNNARESKEIIVFISDKNEIFIDGEKVDEAKLAEHLKQKKFTDDKENFIIIRGDLKSALQTMVSVLGACRVAEITKVKVETKQPAST